MLRNHSNAVLGLLHASASSAPAQHVWLSEPHRAKMLNSLLESLMFLN